MELADILRCPRTGNRLSLNDGDAVVRVHGAGVTYPIVDGIVDFCPDVKDKISKAYDACSSRYDAYMAYATSPGMFAKIFDVQNKRFTTVTCTQCSYTEIYRSDSSGLGDVFDFFTQ